MAATVVAASETTFETSHQRQPRREPMQIKIVDRSPTNMATASATSTRRAYHPSELPPHLMAAIREARMAPEHDHLNALMDDE